MTYIDLSQQIYDAMPVFPGDPEVSIKPFLTVEKDQWAVSQIKMVTHDGTHVNVPRHIDSAGKTVSDYTLSDFIAESTVYLSDSSIEPAKGVVFSDVAITMSIAKVIVAKKPAFVGLSDRFEFDLAAERFLLEKGTISFEKLANCDQLPKGIPFMFYGVPLNLKEADGSPVRAFAVVK